MTSIPVPTRTHVLCLLVFLGLTLFLHFPLFKIQGFMPKDDWKPLRYTLERPYHPQVERNIRDFGFANLRWEWDLGRFTPVYNLVQVFEAHVFKNSPLLWHLETLGLALCSALLLYLIFIRLGVSVLPSLFGGMWFLARGQELWVEKQYQEELGVLFLLAAVFLFVQAARTRAGGRWDWSALVFLALAGFTKETFVFLYPAVLMFRIVVVWEHHGHPALFQSLKRLRKVLFAAGILFLGQILLVLYLYLSGTYAQSLVGGMFDFEASRMAALFQDISPYFSYFVPALGLALLIPSVRLRRMRSGFWLAAGFVLVLWLLPQLFIFKNRGFAGHYIYSAIPGFIALNVLGMEMLRRHKTKVSRWLFAGLALFSLYTIWLSLPGTRNAAEFQVARANAYVGAARHSVTAPDTGGSILLVSDRPWWGLGISFLFDLSRAQHNVPAYFVHPDVPGDQKNGTGGTSLSRELLSRYFPFRLPEDGEGIGIIFATYSGLRFTTAARELFPWFKASEWEQVSVRVPYSRFETGTVFRPAWIRKPQTWECTVFVRKN